MLEWQQLLVNFGLISNSHLRADVFTLAIHNVSDLCYSFTVLRNYDNEMNK